MRVLSIELRTKLFTVLIATLMVTGMTAGISQDMLSPDRDGSGDANFDQSQAEPLGFWDMVGESLSFVNVQDKYEGGESTTIEVRAVADKDFNTNNGQQTVTLYKCADKTCETPPPIDKPQEDSCEEQEWWPEYDDCVDQDIEVMDHSVEVNKGQTVAWNTQLDVPDEEAQYIVVGYVWKDGIATDVSKEKFVVGDSEPKSPSIIKQIRVFLEQLVVDIQKVFN